MKLSDLLVYEKITLQCHDNPDADALASAFGLYCYFKSKDKDVQIVYGGRNPIQKSSLLLMMNQLGIEANYYPDKNIYFQGLLITVDCQYGESNTTPFESDKVAIIDHHQPGTIPKADPEYTEIHSYLGSCSTLIWQMLIREEFPVTDDHKLCTALYYGLMTDTSNFVELKHPIDRDMQDAIPHNAGLISRLINSNISLKELEIAGVALIRYVYNEEYHYAVVHSQPCDPNLLGLINDLVLQVDTIDTSVIFNETSDGFKFSVRSCVKETNADELAMVIAEGVGGGGGHKDKAGGFVSASRLAATFGSADMDTFLGMRLNAYFSSTEIIHTDKYIIDKSKLKEYVKKDIIVGVVDPLSFLPENTNITIRTLEGDINTVVDSNCYIMIGIHGEAYPIKKTKFNNSYAIVSDEYSCQTDYNPKVINRDDNTTIDLVEYAKSCKAKQITHIMAMETDHRVKIFTEWDSDNYMLGKPGDFMACRTDDYSDVYIIARNIFFETYEPV